MRPGLAAVARVPASRRLLRPFHPSCTSHHLRLPPNPPLLRCPSASPLPRLARTMSSPSAQAPSAPKRQKSDKDVPYQLIYWPGLPGRGEHVRLAFEEAGAEYSEPPRQPQGSAGRTSVQAYLGDRFPPADDEHNTPLFAPPILRHGDLVISQTPNILLYVGRRLGLVPDEAEDPDGVYRVNGLALTALDGLSNEPHDCHHPIANSLYFEDQVEESKRKAQDYVRNRLPAFLAYFERVLRAKASGEGPWLYGGRLTYADLVLFQCLDGVQYMFPKATAKLKKSGDYARVFGLYEAVKERPKIKAYLASDRRQKYSLGIYRYYKELDFEG